MQVDLEEHETDVRRAAGQRFETFLHVAIIETLSLNSATVPQTLSNSGYAIAPDAPGRHRHLCPAGLPSVAGQLSRREVVSRVSAGAP
jgi:hypothetical protein